MSDEIMKLVAQRKQLDETFRRKEKDLELHRLNWRDACKKIELHSHKTADRQKCVYRWRTLNKRVTRILEMEDKMIKFITDP